MESILHYSVKTENPILCANTCVQVSAHDLFAMVTGLWLGDSNTDSLQKELGHSLSQLPMRPQIILEIIVIIAR